jgi:hypothetical protein
MCISTETFKEIETVLAESSKITNNPLPLLKGSFPDLGFVRMSARDFDEPPFSTLEHYNLFLLDTREHCVQLTNDLSVATSIVLAQK